MHRQEFDDMAVRMLGAMTREGTVQEYEEQWRKVLQVYEELIGMNILDPMNISSRRQIQTVLNKLQ
jgi:hypothetical protein